MSLNHKEEIAKIKDNECYLVPESDYGKAEIWLKYDRYFLFETPNFGGTPIFHKSYSLRDIDIMLQEITSWS